MCINFRNNHLLWNLLPRASEKKIFPHLSEEQMQMKAPLLFAFSISRGLIIVSRGESELMKSEMQIMTAQLRLTVYVYNST